MSEAPSGTPRDARRDSILASAIHVFAEHGFFGARIRDIAAGAGIAEGTIYLYFGGKDDLLLTAFRETVGAFCETARGELARPAPFAEKLTRFVRLQFEQIDEDPAFATVLLLESRQSSKFYGGAVRDVMRSYAAVVDALLHEGAVAGVLRRDLNLVFVRQMLVGALEEIELEWLLSTRDRPLAPTAPSVVDVLLRGMLSPSAA